MQMKYGAADAAPYFSIKKEGLFWTDPLFEYVDLSVLCFKFFQEVYQRLYALLRHGVVDRST